MSKAIKIMKGKTNINGCDMIRGISIDTRTLMPGELFFALKGQNTDGHKYVGDAMKKGAIGAVVHDATNISGEIVVEDTLHALGELAHYYQSMFRPRIIAITGTNGKTTVKNLIATILRLKYNVLFTKKSFNSLIGMPLTIFEVSGDEDYVVLEMGTSNPGEIKRLCEIARPFIGIITNIGPGHLEKLGSIDGVLNEKKALLESLPSDGIGFLGVDINTRIRCNNIIRFSFNGLETARIDENGSSFVYNGEEYFTPLLGMSNIRNCIIALTVTEKLGITAAEQQTALKMVKPEPGRMEPVRHNGLLIINDTYNANPNSVKSAIEFISNLKRRKIVILGDMLELGSKSEQYHRDVGEYVRVNCQHLFTFGDNARLYGGRHFESKEELVREVCRYVNGDEVILVKASRAMRFEEIVRKLLRRL